MNFEVLKRSHVKRNIIVAVIIILILSAVILTFTKAKYKTTASIPLVNGTINYDLSDLNLIGAYIQEGEEYKQVNEIPLSGYEFNEEKSYCTVNGENINATINFDIETQTLSVVPLTKKGTKCYLYFDETVLVRDTLLANYSTVKTRTFPFTTTTTVTETTTGTIYKSANSNQYDNDGEVYYFAGNPSDNWVKWAGFYWRIIRINGNGSIRMIYQGTSPNTTGTGTELQTSAFNSSYNRSEYVGLKYTSGQQHGTETDSTILGELNKWYQNNIVSYANDIDTNVGFCSDRNMASGYSWSSQPSSTIYYAVYDRVARTDTSVNPSFKCSNSSDLLKIPIGLITADEVVMAGLAWRGSPTSNYLYTNSTYWTMSPYSSDGSASVFRVHSSGSLIDIRVDLTYGVRPVINIRSDVAITGTGTTTDPYKIVS